MQLVAHGWKPSTQSDLPLWRKLLLPTRTWGKITRPLSRQRNGGAEARAVELRTLATLEEALEFSRTASGAKVEHSPWAENSGLEEVPTARLHAFADSAAVARFN